MEKLGVKIFFTNDLREYNDKELTAIVEAVQKEQKRRADDKRFKLWSEMVCAMRKYIDEYGSFNVSDGVDTITINETMVDDWEREEIIVE